LRAPARTSRERRAGTASALAVARSVGDAEVGSLGAGPDGAGLDGADGDAGGGVVVGAAVGVVGVAVSAGSGVAVVGLAGLVIEGSPWAVRGSGVVNERPRPQDTPAPA